MTPLYKEGLYWLILLAATALVYAILAMLIGPGRACGAFGLLGLAGFQPLLYRKRGQTVVMDERDTHIALRRTRRGLLDFLARLHAGRYEPLGRDFLPRRDHGFGPCASQHCVWRHDRSLDRPGRGHSGPVSPSGRKRGEVSATISNQLRRLRFEHGEMTQQELAVRVGVTRQTIIAIEGGKYTPSLELAFRLARAFDVGVEDLFRWNDTSA